MRVHTARQQAFRVQLDLCAWAASKLKFELYAPVRNVECMRLVRLYAFFSSLYCFMPAF